MIAAVKNAQLAVMTEKNATTGRGVAGWSVGLGCEGPRGRGIEESRHQGLEVRLLFEEFARLLWEVQVPRKAKKKGYGFALSSVPTATQEQEIARPRLRNSAR
jgi:hypothetical protein